MSKENIDDIIALSPMQNLMLTHAITATGSHALSNQFHYRISGALDEKRFAAAWQQLIDRHGALRTCFLWEGLKEPVQVIRTTARLGFTFTDLSDLERPERDDRLAAMLESDRAAGFDLRRAPLMRIALIRLADDEYTMIWTRHHLILDRWCVDILFEELFTFYAGAATGLPPAGSFRDYVQWLRSRNEEEARQFWRDEFAGCSGPSLLFDGQGGLSASADGLANDEDSLDAADYERLKLFARGARLSVATVLQGGLALAMSQMSGATEVVFGITVSGRPPEIQAIEHTLGSFINNVPVRVRIDREQRIIEWLREIHNRQSRRAVCDYLSPATIHQCTGFHAARPMYDVLAILHSPATEEREGPGFRIEQVAGPLDSTVPLTLSLAENRGRLEIVGAYDPEAIPRDTVRALLGACRDSLLALIDSGDRPLGEIASVGDAGAADSAPVPGAGPAAPVAADSSVCEEVALAGEAATRLGAIWRRILGVGDIGLDDDFFALGGTSIQAALLFTEIEADFGVALPISTLFKSGNIRKLLEVLDRPVPRVSSLVEIQPRGEPPAMFVVPGVGGNVVSLEPVARALGRHHPYYGLQSKGLDGHDQPAQSIEQIAAEFVTEMRDRRTVPYVICGICWGALVAFEMAQQLQRAGEPPALLIILDPIFDTPAHKAGTLAPNRFTVFAKFVRKRLRLYRNILRDIEPGQRLAWVREKVTTLGRKSVTTGLLHGNRSELTRTLVSDRNLDAMLRYRAQPYPGSVCVLLTRDRDPSVDQRSRERFMEFVPDRTPVIAVPGFDTGDAISGHNAGALAAILRREIDASLAAARGN